MSSAGALGPAGKWTSPSSASSWYLDAGRHQEARGGGGGAAGAGDHRPREGRGRAARGGTDRLPIGGEGRVRGRRKGHASGPAAAGPGRGGGAIGPRGQGLLRAARGVPG